MVTKSLLSGLEIKYMAQKVKLLILKLFYNTVLRFYQSTNQDRSLTT